jgi:hypothetical protein
MCVGNRATLPLFVFTVQGNTSTTYDSSDQNDLCNTPIITSVDFLHFDLTMASRDLSSAFLERRSAANMRRRNTDTNGYCKYEFNVKVMHKMKKKKALTTESCL